MNKQCTAAEQSVNAVKCKKDKNCQAGEVCLNKLCSLPTLSEEEAVVVVPVTEELIVTPTQCKKDK